MTELAPANGIVNMTLPEIETILEPFTAEEREVIHVLVQGGFVAGCVNTLASKAGIDPEPMTDELGRGAVILITMLAEAKGWTTERMLEISDTADLIGGRLHNQLHAGIAQLK